MDVKIDIKNDGFIYCINFNFDNKQVIKIGLTKLCKNDTILQCKNKLKSRYNTYYPNYELLYFKRVSNVIKAEKYVKKELKKYHLKNELYLYKNKRYVKTCFNKLDKLYININDYIKQLNINELTELNKKRRKN
jgi:hypothetical protein